MTKEMAKFPSKSSPGKYYTIFEAADGSNYCNCWAWKKNRMCNHLKHFLMNMQYKAEPVADLANAVQQAASILESMEDVLSIINN